MIPVRARVIPVRTQVISVRERVSKHTVRDFALEIAYKKFTGDFGLDFLAHLRNQVGARQGSDF